MDRPVELIPLNCIQCDTAIPAQPDEVAWVCARCGRGMLLDNQKGLAPLAVNYMAGSAPSAKGKPFWVAQGRVTLRRETYSGNQGQEAQLFWNQPRQFFVPAFSCSLEALLDLGGRMLQSPPHLQPGPVTLFEPVTLLPEDVGTTAEFIVMSLEANRKDKLKEILFKLDLEPPVLWVLP